MITDSLQNWLQHLGMPWWGIGLAYPAFALLLDVLLSLIFGGKKRLREAVSDPVHFYWIGLMLGAIPVVYTANWIATSVAIASLAQNGIDVPAWRYHFLACADSWLQWPILALSLALVLSTFRRYRVVRREKTWFAKLPWPAHLLRTMLMDVPVAYMVCMTLISLIDSIVAFNRIFVHVPSAITLDIWHPDGLYGLKPAYNLLLGQFGVGLLASFLPALMILREAEQTYSWMYKVAVLAAILTAIMLASILLRNFSSAIGRVKLSAVTTIADDLQAHQPPPAEAPQEIHRTNLLLAVNCHHRSASSTSASTDRTTPRDTQD